MAPAPFTLDRFQREAIAAIDAGRNVLVAAPTGAGKTVVAEHAVARALAGGRRAFYTTPIKALSNQKFSDLVDLHGADQVGLLTGDNAIRPDAPVVVMTTEVLRNMIYASSPALETLDWQTPAEAVQTMVPLLTRVHAALVAGETPDQELQVAIYKANSKLVEAYLEVRGKLPTHAQGNGEYAHPAFMANLVDAYLESAGQPLDEGQRAQIEALGRAYDAAWAQAQLGYGEQTVTSRKLYDELVLKAEFRAGLDRLLSGAQLALLVDEALRHVSGMDLFSPVLVFSASAKVLPGADEAKLLEQLQGTLSSLGVELALPGVDRVLADWLAAAAGPPVAEGQTWSYTLADGLRALDAQAAAFEQLTQLAPPDEQRAALRDASWVVLPRLTSPE